MISPNGCDRLRPAARKLNQRSDNVSLCIRFAGSSRCCCFATPGYSTTLRRFEPHLTNLTKSAGMVGMGMIFDDTYRPLFEHAHADGPLSPRLRPGRGRTGRRRQPHRQPGRALPQATPATDIAPFASFAGADAVAATARPRRRCRLRRHARRSPFRAAPSSPSKPASTS